MWKILFATLFFITFFTGHSFAQDTLPKITVRNFSGRIIISWRNNYGATIKNLNIQRSYDSLRNFATIGSVLSPANRENGFADTRAPYTKMFYRVFIGFEGGTYLFSYSSRPVKDTSEWGMAMQDMYVVSPNGFVSSKNIYTGRDNNVIINLPHATTKKYSIKFFDDNNLPLFEINKISEPYLILDKVNFLHAGWFYYDLYESGILLEKYKFFIPKDGKAASVNSEQGKRNQ